MQVRQSERGNYVPDLTTVQVHSMAEVLQLLTLGDANRSSACTNMNEHSSRSHLMLTVQVQVQLVALTYYTVAVLACLQLLVAACAARDVCMLYLYFLLKCTHTSCAVYIAQGALCSVRVNALRKHYSYTQY
jgi:Kinesin motor domain